MVARALAAIALSAGLLGGLTACSGEGASTSCSSTSQCTVTFDRSVADANINVLGVEIAVVSATADDVTLKVAGQEVTIQSNQSVNAAGLQLKLQSVNDSQIVVEISRA